VLKNTVIIIIEKSTVILIIVITSHSRVEVVSETREGGGARVCEGGEEKNYIYRATALQDERNNREPVLEQIIT